MWLLIRTSLSYDRKILGISLAAAIVISFAIIFDNDGDAQAADSGAVSWVYFNAYIISLVLSVIFYSQEARERLYTQLPLTRLQIILSDLIVWFIWTALFYGATCFIPLITGVPIEPGHFVDVLLGYLFAITIMALLDIAANLSNYRNRYWQIAYIIALVLVLIAFVDRSNPPQGKEEWFQFSFFEVSINLFAISPLLAVTSIGAMCWVQYRREFYLK